MIFSTTHELQGMDIKEYVGIVVGETFLDANILSGLFGSSNDYQKEMSKARECAFEKIKKEALKLGANAIVGVNIDYEVIGDSGTMMMVCASGTAVKVSR